MTEHPDPVHVRQVAEIVDLVVNAFMLAHQFGATGSVCCDAALSSFLRVVSIFRREQDTIDAMPLIVAALEKHMHERLRVEADVREKQQLAETECGTMQ